MFCCLIGKWFLDIVLNPKTAVEPGLVLAYSHDQPRTAEKQFGALCWGMYALLLSHIESHEQMNTKRQTNMHCQATHIKIDCACLNCWPTFTTAMKTQFCAKKKKQCEEKCRGTMGWFLCTAVLGHGGYFQEGGCRSAP